MKYFILGREDPLNYSEYGQYTELGWESHVFNFELRRMLIQKEITRNSVTIVTVKDRMFLYETLFTNVISYDDFLSLNVNSNDIIQFGDLGISVNPNDEVYRIYLENKKIMCDFKHYDIEEPNNFWVLHIRFHKFANNRNHPEEFYKTIIEEVKKKYNFKCFIFGAGAKHFENKEENIIHVNLKEYCTLMSKDNCKFIIGPMSGGTLVCQYAANPKSFIYVITPGASYGNGTLFHDHKYNFTGTKTQYIHNLSVENIINNLNKDVV